MDTTNRVYRCQYCNGLILSKDIQAEGSCPCGSRKVRIAFAITEEEMAGLKIRGFEPQEDQFRTDRSEAWMEE